MVNCPFFLKKKEGITLIELIIVLGFIAFMAVAVLLALNPVVQLGKARDARRKSDLSKLKNVLEDYYNDHKQYPDSLNCGQPLDPYLAKIPCDPLTHQSYVYVKTPSYYYIYTKLEYENDPIIDKLGCAYGCGPGCNYNYGVSSSNVNLESCGECEGDWYGCQEGGGCNNMGSGKRPKCEKGGPVFCNDSSCGGGCDGKLPCI